MKPEIFHEDKMNESEKTSQNSFFFIFDPFMVKMQSEKYFFNFFQVLLKRFKQKSMNWKVKVTFLLKTLGNMNSPRLMDLNL